MLVLGQRLLARAQLELLSLRQLLGLLVPEPAAEVVGPELPEPGVPAVDVVGPALVLAVAQQKRRTQVEEVRVETWKREKGIKPL